MTGASDSVCINISEDNLLGFKELVSRTGLGDWSAADLCKALLKLQLARRKRMPNSNEAVLALSREDFTRNVIPRIVPHIDRMSQTERDCTYQNLLDFFCLYQHDDSLGRQQHQHYQGLNENEVDLKELAVGLCFFCSGNKSNKLATGFELLDEQQRGYLSKEQLYGYLRSYLLALVALSFLVPSAKQQQRRILSSRRRAAMRWAIESGAKWTLEHFLNYLELSTDSRNHNNGLSFDKFANWYSTGGYNISPWLELLDHKKVSPGSRNRCLTL